MSQPIAPHQGVATSWQQNTSPVIIGKDMIELLSSSMYVDSMTIYREYIQNAADAIDQAGHIGLLPGTDLGKVEISIDTDSRTVHIRDNGIGISREKFVETLTAFGASSKRGTHARGFRGVGRLAGLGYCQELIFRSRASGESDVSEMRWDCRSIKAALRTPEGVSSLQEIVNAVVSVRFIDGKGLPDHFFEVELRGIVRHKNDSLLNNIAVYDYLSEVAPVPFSPEFKFGEEIASALSRHTPLGYLEIRVEGIHSLVYRPHRNDLQARGGVHDHFTELEMCTIPSVDGDDGAIAWVLHHGYKGTIPVSQIRGLRLRSGNIQVGGHDLLQDLFPEPRFNSWTVGEIHTFDKRIIPNGRRDHYEQNIHFNHLTNHISPIARQISARCRQSSIRRNLLHDFHRRETLAMEKLQAIEQGGLSSEGRRNNLQDIDGIISGMRRIITRAHLTTDIQEYLRDITDTLESKAVRLNRYKRRAKSLNRLPQNEREIYERVITLIYECSGSHAVAHALVERIISKLLPKKRRGKKESDKME
jgi:hypothetical protein